MPGNAPYVSSSAVNNGVDDFISNAESVRKFNDCMTIANSGSVGKTFFHEYEFVASDHVTAMKAPCMNKYIYLFIVTIAQRLKEKYSFNREINETRINRERITLPVDDKGNPDWPFMEEYMRERERFLLERYSCSAEGECEEVPLDGVKWGEFVIGDLFNIFPGKRLRKEDMTAGDKPFVGASDTNNGVTTFTANSNASEDCNVLGVNYDGSIGECFYHPYTCLFSDSVKRFKLSQYDGNKYTYLFIKQAILKQKIKYSYGYKFNETRMQRQKIQLPIDEFGRPDYSFMEKFMRSLEKRLLRSYVNHLQAKSRNTPPKILRLDCVNWRSFYISDVVQIISGRDIYDDERVSGFTPYIGSSAMNNGITHFVANTNESKEANCISVNRNGSVGFAFWHPYEALFSNDCRKLRPISGDEYTAKFIAAQIKAQREKYNYGYKMGTARLKRQKIILPVNETGNPDYEFMSNYVRMIEYEKNFEALSYFVAKLEGRA